MNIQRENLQKRIELKDRSKEIDEISFKELNRMSMEEKLKLAEPPSLLSKLKDQLPGYGKFSSALK